VCARISFTDRRFAWLFFFLPTFCSNAPPRYESSLLATGGEATTGSLMHSSLGNLQVGASLSGSGDFGGSPGGSNGPLGLAG